MDLIYLWNYLVEIMKISIGTKIKDGPWGGGNLFAINLRNYLVEMNHEVIFDLEDDDIDLILLTEPRKTSESSSFTHIDILKYRQFVKKDVIVVHRINECDERKNTNFVNQYLLEANNSADATIFVSSWLKDLFLKEGLECEKISVILSGANSNIFKQQDQFQSGENDILNIVTHHWGANWNKGFNIYKTLDEMLFLEEYKNKFSFTYIGNIPNKFKFSNTNLVKPLSGSELADEIRKSDLYLTASINEPSGNHHIEGAQCGLPLLYINSGGIPEYCDGFGLMFDENNFEEKLNEIHSKYSEYKDAIQNYPHNSDKMSLEYLNLFKSLVDDKANIVINRKTPNIINIVEKFIYIVSRSIKKYIKKDRF
jgi:hypothetical protein